MSSSGLQKLNPIISELNGKILRLPSEGGAKLVYIEDSVKKVIEDPEEYLKQKLLDSIVFNFKILFGDNENTDFSHILKPINSNLNKGIQVDFNSIRYLGQIIFATLVSLKDIKRIYNDSLDEDDIEFIKLVNYIEKKFFLKKSTTQKKVNNHFGTGVEKYQGVTFDSKFIYERQEKIIKYFSDFTDFLYQFKSFFSDKLLDFSENKDINSDSELKIIHFKDLLGQLMKIYLAIKEENLELAGYLYELLKLLSLFIKIQQYLQNDNYNPLSSNITDIVGGTFDTKAFIDDILEGKQIHDIPSLLVLLTYTYEKFDKLFLRKLDTDMLDKFANISVPPKQIKKISDSELKSKIEEVFSLERRRKLLSIFIKKEKLFFGNSKNNFGELADYIISILDSEKLDDISSFFDSNHNEFTEEEFVFIFENNFENTFFVEKIMSIKTIITWLEFGICLAKIKELPYGNFKYLKTITDLNIVSHIINGDNDNKELCLDHELFENKINRYKQLFVYLHTNSLYYGIIENLLSVEFINIENISNNIGKIETFFTRNNIYEVCNRNKKLLSGNDKSMGDLESLCCIFKGLDDGYINQLLDEVFVLGNDDFTYIKVFFEKFDGDDKDYIRILRKGYISKVLKNKNLVDLYIEDSSPFSMSNIIDEISEEISRIPTIETHSGFHDLNLKELYSETEYLIISEMNLSYDCLIHVISIGKLLNGKKFDFITSLSKKKKIEVHNLENLYRTLNFLFNCDAIPYINIKSLLFVSFKLKENSDEILYLYNSFNDVGNLNDKDLLCTTIIRFLKNGDFDIISNYLDNVSKSSLIPNNKMDVFLEKIARNGNNTEKQQLGKELSTFTQEILKSLVPKVLSSTKNSDSGIGTGGATNRLRKFYLKSLLKSENESYSNYLDRIFIINWNKVSSLESHDTNGDNQLRYVHDSSDNLDYLFFEAFAKFASLINEYEKKLKTYNSEVDISNLLKEFSLVYRKQVSEFKKSNEIV